MGVHVLHRVYKTEFGRTMTESKVNRRIQEVLDFWMSGADWLLQERGNRVEDVSRFMDLTNDGLDHFPGCEMAFSGVSKDG